MEFQFAFGNPTKAKKGENMRVVRGMKKAKTKRNPARVIYQKTKGRGDGQTITSVKSGVMHYRPHEVKMLNDGLKKVEGVEKKAQTALVNYTKSHNSAIRKASASLNKAKSELKAIQSDQTISRSEQKKKADAKSKQVKAAQTRISNLNKAFQENTKDLRNITNTVKGLRKQSTEALNSLKAHTQEEAKLVGEGYTPLKIVEKEFSSAIGEAVKGVEKALKTVSPRTNIEKAAKTGQGTTAAEKKAISKADEKVKEIKKVSEKAKKATKKEAGTAVKKAAKKVAKKATKKATKKAAKKTAKKTTKKTAKKTAKKTTKKTAKKTTRRAAPSSISMVVSAPVVKKVAKKKASKKKTAKKASKKTAKKATKKTAKKTSKKTAKKVSKKATTRLATGGRGDNIDKFVTELRVKTKPSKGEKRKGSRNTKTGMKKGESFEARIIKGYKKGKGGKRDLSKARKYKVMTTRTNPIGGTMLKKRIVGSEINAIKNLPVLKAINLPAIAEMGTFAVGGMLHGVSHTAVNALHKAMPNPVTSWMLGSKLSAFAVPLISAIALQFASSRASQKNKQMLVGLTDAMLLSMVATGGYELYNNFMNTNQGLSGVQYTPMNGVDYTPMSGVQYTPMGQVDFTPMSGVDFTPMSGVDFTPMGFEESPADFGAEESPADFGAEESPADFGFEESPADFGAEESPADFGYNWD
jgi:colicin import membrane protein